MACKMFKRTTTDRDSQILTGIPQGLQKDNGHKHKGLLLDYGVLTSGNDCPNTSPAAGAQPHGGGPAPPAGRGFSQRRVPHGVSGHPGPLPGRGDHRPGDGPPEAGGRDRVEYLPVSSPVIKSKKTPRKKCRFVAEVKGKR